jgi:hypothetical protein
MSLLREVNRIVASPILHQQNGLVDIQKWKGVRISVCKRMHGAEISDFLPFWKDPILATKAMKKTAYGDAVV